MFLSGLSAVCQYDSASMNCKYKLRTNKNLNWNQSKMTSSSTNIHHVFGGYCPTGQKPVLSVKGHARKSDYITHLLNCFGSVLNVSW